MKNILRKMGKVKSALMAVLLVAGIALVGVGTAVLVKLDNGISSSADENVRVYYAGGPDYNGGTFATNADAWSAAVAYSKANGTEYDKTVTEANGAKLDTPNTYRAFEGKKVEFRLMEDWVAQPVQGSITATWEESHNGTGTPTSRTAKFTAVDTTFFDSANVTTDGTDVAYTPRAGFHPLGSLLVDGGANIVLDLNGYTLDRNIFQVGDCLDPEDPQQSIDNLIDAGKAGKQTPGNNVLHKNLGQVINVYGHFADNVAYYSSLEVTDRFDDYRDLTVTGNKITHKNEDRRVGMIKGGFSGLSSYEYDGGGITVCGLGTLRLTGGVIAQNASCGRGGGIMAGMEFNAPKTYDISPKIYMKGGIIAQNYSGATYLSSSCSGAMYLVNAKLVEFSGGKMMYNWTSGQGGAIYMGEGGNAHITLDVERNADGTPVNPADEGPEISYNVAAASKLGVDEVDTEIGGGICCSWTDRVSLGKCKIINNRAGKTGGGIFVRSNGTNVGYVDVHDSPVVTGNVQGAHGSQTKSNVYLQDEKIFMEVTGKLTNTVVDADGVPEPQIGVYMSNENITSETKQGIFTTGFVAANGAEDNASKYFFCDNLSYKVNPAVNSEGQLLEAGSMEYVWNTAITRSIKKNGENMTVTLTDTWIGSVDGFGAESIGIDAGGFLKVPKGAKITLDLNGYTLNRGFRNYAKDNGLGIKVEGGTLTIMDSVGTGTITWANSTGRGGAVYVCNDGVLNFESGTITECNAAYGGAIFGEFDKNGGSTINITGGKIIDCRANSGGAIGANGVVNISGGEICSNYADGIAGAIHMSSEDAKLTISGGKIYGNMASMGSGGAILAGDGATVLISGGQIYGNQGNNGGGVYVEKKGSLTITGGQIYGNHAPQGGGVYATDSEVLIDMASGSIGAYTLNTAGSSTEAVGNHADGSGGGIYANDCKITINKANVTYNYAVNGGGGVYLSNCETTVNGINVNGNQVKDHDGAGLYIAAGSFTMNGGSINANKTNAGHGAGLLAIRSEVEMNGGEINGNISVNRGGGLYLVDTTFVMNDGKILGNQATSEKPTGIGGGIYAAASRVTIYGGQIGANSAKYGGGIANDGSILNVFGGIIGGKNLSTGIANTGNYGNYASVIGGGIYTMLELAPNYIKGSGKKIDQQTNICGGEILGNLAANGGGVYIGGSEYYQSDTANDVYDITYADFCVNITAGRIAGNKAENNDGALVGNGYTDELHITGGQISGNYAEGTTGGVSWSGRSVVIDGGKIGGSALNTADAPSQEDVGNRAKEAGAMWLGENTELTVNGGEICNNTATAATGYVGVIFGHNITFNGGHVYGNDSKTNIIYSAKSLTLNSVLIEDNTTGTYVIEYVGTVDTIPGYDFDFYDGAIVRNNTCGTAAVYCTSSLGPNVYGGQVVNNKTTAGKKTGFLLTGTAQFWIMKRLSYSTVFEFSHEDLKSGFSDYQFTDDYSREANTEQDHDIFFRCYDEHGSTSWNMGELYLDYTTSAAGTSNLQEIDWDVSSFDSEAVINDGEAYARIEYSGFPLIIEAYKPNGDRFGIDSNMPVDVGIYHIEIHWDSSSDMYKYKNPSLTVEIVPKEIGLSWTADPVYSGLAQGMSATATGLCGSDQCDVTVEGNYTDAGTGYTCKAVSLSNDNYKLPANVVKVYSIKKAPLTVTVDPQEVVYGDTFDPATCTVTVEGFVNGETREDIFNGQTLSFTCAYAKGKDIGEYEITATGWTAANYEIKFVAGTLTVKRKGVALPEAVTELIYNGSELTGVSVAEGFEKIYKVENGVATNAGTHTATVTLLDNNYCWGADGSNDVSAKEVRFLIKPATLTVVPDEVKVTFGEQPEGTGFKFVDSEGNEVSAEKVVGFTGTAEYAFVNAEGVAFVAGDTTNGKVGEYKIKISNADILQSNNYTFVTGEGKLTVAKAELTLNTVSAENSVTGKAYVGLEMSGVSLKDDGAATAENKNVASDNAVAGTLTWKTAEDGTQIKPTGESTFASPTFTQKFVLVFTPDDTTNYSVVEKEVELTVTQLYATVIQKHPAEFNKTDDVKHFKVDYGQVFDFADADHRIEEGGEATDTNFIVANYEGYDKVYAPAKNPSVPSEGGTLPAMTGTTVDADKIITVSYTEKTVDYKVYHVYQGTDGTYPITPADIESESFASKLASLSSDKLEVENLKEKAGKPATVTVKEMEGLKQDTEAQKGEYAAYKISGTVTGDGKAMFFVFYTRNDYRVMFSLKNGAWAEGFTAPSTVKYGLPIPLTVNPTRTGYTFKGWYTSSAAATNLTEEFKWDLPKAPMPAKTLWLYAGWQANTYTVSLKATCSEVDGAIVNAQSLVAAGFETADGGETYTKLYTYGSYLALPQISADKANFTFWHDIDEHSAETQTPIAAINSTFVKDLADGATIELMAKWAPKTFTVTLDVAGGTLSGTSTGTNTVTATNGQRWSAVLTGITVEKTGFTFNYWTMGENNIIDLDGAVDLTGDATLTAAWEAKNYYIVKGENKISEAGNYKITDSNGELLKLMESTSGATDTASAVHIGDMLTVSITAPNGYSITSITIGSPDDPVTINNGRSIRITEDSVSEDGFIYINVTTMARTYNLQYDFAGGEATADWNPVRSYKADVESVELPGYNGNAQTAQVITKAGYTFEGWYLDNPQEVFTKLEIKQVQISGDLILHASWIAQERVIKLDKNSDTLTSQFGWMESINTVYWDEANGCYTTEKIPGAEGVATTVGMTIKIVQQTPQDYYLLGYSSTKNGAFEYATTLSDEGLPTGEIMFTVKASETENVLYAKWMLAKGNHVLVTRSSNTPSYNPQAGSVVLTGTALGDYGHTVASAKSYLFTWYKVTDINALKNGNFFDENGELVRKKLFESESANTLLKKVQDNISANDKSTNSNSFKLTNVADGGYYICDLEVQIKVNENDTEILQAYADLLDIINVEIEPVTITGITFGSRIINDDENDIIYNAKDRSDEMSVTLKLNDDFCKSLDKDDNGQFILMADGSKIYVNYYYYPYEGFKREEFNPETDLAKALNAAGGAGVKDAGMYITVAVFTMDEHSNYAKLSPMFAEMEIGQKSIKSVKFASEVKGDTPFVKAYDGTKLGITATSEDICDGDDVTIELEGHEKTDYSAEEYVALVKDLSGIKAGNYKLALTQAASTQKYQITRGTRDMSAFEFVYGGEKYVEGTTKVYYDGTQKLITLNVGETNPLPKGVTVEYAVEYKAFNPSYQLNGANAAKDSSNGVVGAGGTEAGVYKVTASFTDTNSANYNDIEDMTINFTVEMASYYSEDPASPLYKDTLLEGFEGGSYPFKNGANHKVYVENLEKDAAKFKVTYDVYEKIGDEYQLLATGTKAELDADDTLLLSGSGSEYKVEATVEFVKDADKNNYAEMEIEPITIIIAQGAIDHITVTLKADAQYFYGEGFDKTTIEKITVYYEATEEGGELQPVEVTEANKIALSEIFENEACTAEHVKFSRIAGADNAYKLWIKFVETTAPIQMVVGESTIEGVTVKQKITEVRLQYYVPAESGEGSWVDVPADGLEYAGEGGYQLRVTFACVDENGEASEGYATVSLATADESKKWAVGTYALNVANDANGLYVFVNGEGVAYDETNPMTVDLKINKKTAAVNMFFNDSEYDDTKFVYCNNLADSVKNALSVKYTLVDGTQKLLKITDASITAITKAGTHKIKVEFAADDADASNYKLESEQLEIVVNKKVITDVEATWYYTNDNGMTWTNTNGETSKQLIFTGNDYQFKVTFTGVDGKTTEVINSAKYKEVDNSQKKVVFAEDADVNYRIESFFLVEIIKKPVEFTWSDEGKDYTYTGEAIVKPTATISNIENAEDVVLTYKLYKGTAIDEKNLTDTILEAGTYLIVVSLDDPTILANYSLSSETTKHKIVVEKAGIEATVSIADVTYGEEIKPAVSGTPEGYDGTITYKYATAENGEYTETVPVNAGSYWVKAIFSETAQYGKYETLAVEFEVSKKEITVTVTDAKVVVGHAAPTKFDVTYSGFVGEENEKTAGFTGELTFTVVDYSTSAAVGKRFIVNASGLSATNYTFSYNPGFLTVVKENKKLTLITGSTLEITKNDDGSKYLGKVVENQKLEDIIAQFEGTDLKIKATNMSGKELAATGVVGTGTVIELLDEDGTVLDKVTVTVMGDLNGDGRVNALDKAQQHKIISKLTLDVSKAVTLASDTNGDGRINALDKAKLQKHISKLQSLFEVASVSTYALVNDSEETQEELVPMVEREVLTVAESEPVTESVREVAAVEHEVPQVAKVPEAMVEEEVYCDKLLPERKYVTL